MPSIIMTILASALAFSLGLVMAEYQTINPKQYEAAAVACYQNGGIKEVSVGSEFLKVVCTNKAEFNIGKK